MQIKNLCGKVIFETDEVGLSRANLSGASLFGANLSGASLFGANLSGASLFGANLSGANLSGANLSGASLFGANLSGANLSGASLFEANLREADLLRADLRRASLREVDLRGADLREADLRGADLFGANLSGASLFGADLFGADLFGADLREADLRKAKTLDPLIASQLLIVPETGSFEGWKLCRHNVIVNLLIPANAKRSNATGRKCRASEALVLEVYGADTGISILAETFTYSKGQTVKPNKPFDNDRWSECSSGIHFFLTRLEAENHR